MATLQESGKGVPITSSLRAHADPTVLAKPFAIFNIELTNRCPFRCVMCARTHAMTREQGDMTFDMFQRVIDEFIAVNAAAAGTAT